MATKADQCRSTTCFLCSAIIFFKFVRVIVQFQLCRCIAQLHCKILVRLSLVTNNGHLLTYFRKYDHTTPLLRDLHWLPVRERIEFKLAVLVFRCLHGTASVRLRRTWRTSCVVWRTSTQEDGCVLLQRLLS